MTYRTIWIFNAHEKKKTKTNTKYEIHSKQTAITQIVHLRDVNINLKFQIWVQVFSYLAK